MRYSVADFAIALVIAGVAGLGGGFAVYAGYDDAPGGVLIGLLLILGSAALALRSRRRLS